MPGSKQVSFVGKALGHKPTTFAVAKNKIDRRGKDCLYPSFDIPSQTNLSLSSHHLLSPIGHEPALPHV